MFRYLLLLIFTFGTISGENMKTEFTCMLAATISVDTLCNKKFKPPYSNPVVGLVMLTAENIACSKPVKPVIKSGITQGCRWTIEVSGSYVKIIIEEINNNARKAALVYKSLNTYPGIHWLIRQLRQ